MSSATRALALIACCIACACQNDASPTVASVHPRAAWVLESGAPRIGEIALLDAVVTTPPGHTPAPLSAPRDVPGFELLGSENRAVLKQPGRWIHRTRLRIRASNVGRFEWPAASIEVESLEGERSALTLEPLSIEVRSVMTEHPDRDTPYGVIEAPGAPGSGVFLQGVAVGGLGALALLGLVSIVRGRRSPPLPPAQGGVSTPHSTPWVEARSALARARDTSDPLRAAHIAAAALTRYTALRFGADTRARTTEELEATTPPLRATSRWPVFLSILRELDALRFGPGTEHDGAVARAAELLTRSEIFVDESTPSDAEPP